MKIENLVSLRELSVELGLKKSRLNYYAWLDLLTPVKVMNKMLLFDREQVVKQIERINSLQKTGLTLKEIAALERKTHN